jgi:hypothetical protein
MLRGMRSLLRDYQRMQAQRDKAIAEVNPAAMERAGYWFYGGLKSRSGKFMLDCKGFVASGGSTQGGEMPGRYC